MFCPSGLLNNCKKRFLLLAETTGETYRRLYTRVYKFYAVKMFHWYQMNSKVVLYNTALSAQICYIAVLSLYCRLPSPQFYWSHCKSIK